MDNNDKIIQNIKIGKLITAITNFLSSVVFLIAYIMLDNIIFLIVSGILIVSSIIIIIYFSGLERKYKSNFAKDIKKEIK